jgi:stress response protein YsnF
VEEDHNPNFDKKSENGSPNRISSPDENRVRKKLDYEIDEIRVIPPKLPREFMHIVRPAYLTKENSIVSLTSKLANTVKDTTDETISSIKQLAGPLVDNNVEDKSVQVHDSKFQQHGSTEKKDVHDVVSIEKKWITKKTKIEVPVLYEKVFVNDQELRFGVEEAITEIKDRILDTVSVEHHKENNMVYDWVPLFGTESEMQTEFPLYAEELVISKRKVMVGKVVIRKRQITKKQNMDENK